MIDERITGIFGGEYATVSALLRICRAFWVLAFQPPASSSATGRRAKKGNTRIIELDLVSRNSAVSPAVLVELVSQLEIVTGSTIRLADGLARFPIKFFSPSTLIQTFSRSQEAEPDHRYYLMKAIRETYRCRWSHEYIHAFGLMAAALTGMLRSPRGHGLSTRVLFEREVTDALARSVAIVKIDSQKNLVDLFVETCRAANYIIPDYREGKVRILPDVIDAEFLISNLFGLPTRIKGLDELFGGGGLILPEALTADPGTLQSRVMFALGRFGAGKSLFSLQLAAEVANKGGIAWFMPLEQKPEDCLHAMRSMGMLGEIDKIRIACTVEDARSIIDNPVAGVGALIILGSRRNTFDEFREAFRSCLDGMSRFSLRLLVIDPITVIIRDKGTSIEALRVDAVELFEDAKQKGVNVLMTAETETGQNDDLYSWQNLSDTVFYLSLAEENGYVQRYFEITKSRLQRELRGKHSAAIISGVGLVISPSSGAVRVRVQQRRLLPPDRAIRLGWAEWDKYVGTRTLFAGDVIALVGIDESFKTYFGVEFLLGIDRRENRGRAESLLVAARDPKATVLNLVRNWTELRSGRAKRYVDIKVRCLPAGSIKPGHILQEIEGALVRARREGRLIDRVMIDDVAHWEMSAPFVSQDQSFGDALVELMRHYEVTSLLVCDERNMQDLSVLQRSIIDNADCAIEFSPVELQGTARTMVRVQKSRNMGHSRESLELRVGPRGLELLPSFSLLRIEDGRVAKTVPVRLFLHSESTMQGQYNDSVRERLDAFMQGVVKVESRERFQFDVADRLGLVAGIDELHIVQLDEFEQPRERGSPDVFQDRSVEKTRHALKEWSEWYAPALGRGIVPYYANVAMLAHRQDVTSDVLENWESIADECDKRADDQYPFFSFQMDSDEHYNCLFLEILLSLAPVPAKDRSACGLRAWLRNENAIRACELYRRVCKKAHFGGVSVGDFASVWRHWYSTLNQMLSDMPSPQRRDIVVAPLPGSVSVAGDWYLSVPRYSAGRDTGHRIIDLLTSHEAELDRLGLGVGLPTRPSFYRDRRGTELVSSFLSIDLTMLNRIMEGRFKRSEFQCYPQVTKVLSLHLHRIIELEGSEGEVRASIVAALGSLDRAIAFLETDEVCGRCQPPTGNGTLISI